ncbi:phosphate ABC transporter substrate-binding protein PstS [uncultured Thiohalocapsa sp.]|uniref:phosphate ABC transporter substrate-binding protein PstS n=1 Tax=uncultured Thiohalocapsa sp. TaxID=768990 RepID=UPI0025E89AC9|nr:phosphate ABC transporter substrate-binding protein PstS [uncultured Thiohalocapsa sp.]
MNHTRPMARLGHLLFAVLLLALAAPTQAEDAEQQALKLLGTGASFPAPLYLRWFRDYFVAHPHVRLDYQSIGSAGGVKDLIGGRVDFAGTDLQLTDDEAAQIPGGVRQLPMAAGAIVVIYNLEGVPELKLSRDALLGLFSGSIARWNDPAIAATNPDVTLPDLPVVVVARADASGTTYKFTRHLSALSPSFAEAVGASMKPEWPDAFNARSALVRSPGNGGVAATVRAVPGSIGYVQYAWGFLPGISIAALENRSGKIVAPGKVGFDAALGSIMENHSLTNATDPVGEAAYPIVGLSWLILRNEYDDPAKLPTLKAVIEYALGPGQAVTEQLGYVRFPDPAIEYVEQRLK